MFKNGNVMILTIKLTKANKTVAVDNNKLKT